MSGIYLFSLARAQAASLVQHTVPLLPCGLRRLAILSPA